MPKKRYIYYKDPENVKGWSKSCPLDVAGGQIQEIFDQTPKGVWVVQGPNIAWIPAKRILKVVDK